MDNLKNAIAEYSKLTKEEKSIYDISLKRRWDNKAVMDYAKEEGKREGKLENKLEIAANLKKLGQMSLEDIAKVTDLSVEEIEKL